MEIKFDIGKLTKFLWWVPLQIFWAFDWLLTSSWVVRGPMLAILLLFLVIAPWYYSSIRSTILQALVRNPTKANKNETNENITNQKSVANRSPNVTAQSGDNSPNNVNVAGDNSQNTIRNQSPVEVGNVKGNFDNSSRNVENINVTINLYDSNAPIKTIHSPVGEITTQPFKATSNRGGEAEVQLIVLYKEAIWKTGSSTSFINQRGDINFHAFLDSRDFASLASSQDVIVSLGLDSAIWNDEVPRSIDLSQSRAVSLCAMIAKKGYIDKSRTKIIGLPLGYHSDASVTQQEAIELRQRAVILLGISNATSDLKSADGERRIIEAVLRKDDIKNFDARLYSEVKGNRRLNYFTIESGTFDCTKSLFP